jgi:hypothetical protein
VHRLQGELQRALIRKELWAAEFIGETSEEGGAERQDLAASHTNHPRVRFGKEAIVREYRIGSEVGEQYVGESTVIMLSDDRKRTAGKFKAKKTRFENRLSGSDA